jgi:Protein of unknown function (DUF3830)
VDITPRQGSLSGVIICPAYVEGQRLRVNSFTVLTQLLHIQMRRSVKWLDGQIYGSCDDCIVFFWRTSRNHARERQVSSSLHSSTANSCTRSSSDLLIRIATLEFTARLEETAAHKTCDAFQKLLPFKMKILHCRWSGEACWVPLGKWDAPLDAENQTNHPSPGQILLYAAGPSEPELLIPYGACVFNSKIGQLEGNHFLTIADEHERLRKLGQLVLWQGAQDCVIERVVGFCK